MIAGILGIIYAVFRILKTFLVKYVTHGIVIGLQLSFTTSAILVVVAFVVFSITAIVTLYNQIQSLLDYIASGSSSSQILTCFFNVLDCSGILLAFNNGITLIYTAVAGVAIFYIFKFFLYGIKFIGNELFKLGVLIGQALS